MFGIAAFFVSFLAMQVNSMSSSDAKTTNENQTTVPTFMGNLYNNVQSGKLKLFNIIHSNEAIDVQRTRRSLEAVFSDLGFGKKEMLKKAKLRLNFLNENKCSRMFSLSFIDGNTMQVFNSIQYVAKQRDVTIIPVTSSLKQFMKGAQSVNRTLLLRVVFHNSSLSDQSICSHDVIDDVGNAVYLVSHTSERNNIKHNKIPSRSGTPLKRTQRRSTNSKKVCQNHKVYVNLTSSNSTISLPLGFWTSACGRYHPIPIGASETHKFIANSIRQAVQRANVQNPKCCMPVSFQRIHILYSDNKKHVVLRNFDKIAVTKCACDP